MLSLVERLLNGNDPKLPGQLAGTKEFWLEFFEKHKNSSEATLAKALGDAQVPYEWLFGPDRSRPFAKEMMPVTCLGTLYAESTDWEKDKPKDKPFAQKVVRAFRKSLVSVEIKGSYLDDTAKMFDLH
jgi:hypothetical protein